jgi:hypothetical protein
MCKRLFVTVGGARWNSRCVSAGEQISRSTRLLFLLATGPVAAAAPKYIQGHYAVPQTPQNTGITLGGNYVTLTGGLWSPPRLPSCPWSYADASAGNGPAPNAKLEAAPVGYDPTPYLNSFQLASGSWAAGQATSIASVTGNFGVTYNFDVDMNGNTGTNLGAFQSSNPPPSTPGTLSTVGYSTPQTPGNLNTVKQ